mmetsp:Transcript_40639/g.85080  ORF Transcript_40639/g.85080 Transcript_40639/m.85080 type:complete len:216 (-) Transcript_40639:349-996(-)
MYTSNTRRRRRPFTERKGRNSKRGRGSARTSAERTSEMRGFSISHVAKTNKASNEKILSGSSLRVSRSRPNECACLRKSPFFVRGGRTNTTPTLPPHSSKITFGRPNPTTPFGGANAHDFFLGRYHTTRLLLLRPFLFPTMEKNAPNHKLSCSHPTLSLSLPFSLFFQKTTTTTTTHAKPQKKHREHRETNMRSHGSREENCLARQGQEGGGKEA